MNIRRGLHRIILVLGVGYLIAGCLWLYNDWENQRSRREFEFSRCLEAVRDPGDSITRITEADCLKWHPPVSERSEVLAFFVIPILLYCAWKVLAWIGRVFDREEHPPD